MHLVRRIGIALEAVEQGLRLGVHPRVQKKRRRRELVAVGGGAVQGVVQGFLPLSGADLAFDLIQMSGLSGSCSIRLL